jgi:hypothetical protein
MTYVGKLRELVLSRTSCLSTSVYILSGHLVHVSIDSSIIVESVEDRGKPVRPVLVTGTRVSGFLSTATSRSTLEPPNRRHFPRGNAAGAVT